MYRPAQRRVAVVYGVVCHASFAAAIATMMVAIHRGLTLGHGRLPGAAGVAANVALVLQFAIGHSVFLSDRGRRLLARLAPTGIGKDLSTTIYATIAAWQLLLTFVLWTPSGIIWWDPHGVPFVVLTALYATAWLLLLKTMVDAGLGVQMGYLGWLAVVRDHRPEYPGFTPRGTFAHVRQPIYVAFTLTLWLAPMWTPDRLVLAILWTGYCVVGPRWKERRYLRFHGEKFAAYQSRVPYWLPHLGSIAARSRRA